MRANAAPGKGFIALMTAVIVSASLLLMAATGNLSGWYARSDILDLEFKKQSEVLAITCAERALLLLAHDPLYSGNTTVAAGRGTCTVGPVTTAGGLKKFTAEGTYDAAYTTLRIAADAATLEVASWEEIHS